MFISLEKQKWARLSGYARNSNVYSECRPKIAFSGAIPNVAQLFI